MTFFDRKDALALFILRLGLVWFMFLWAAHKLITPTQYQQLARHFDGVEVSVTQIYIAGGLQIALCLLALLGVLRPFSYGSLALMHLYTVTRRWEGFLDPFALCRRLPQILWPCFRQIVFWGFGFPRPSFVRRNFVRCS